MVGEKIDVGRRKRASMAFERFFNGCIAAKSKDNVLVESERSGNSSRKLLLIVSIVVTISGEHSFCWMLLKREVVQDVLPQFTP